ncbi:MAG: glycosyltransferase family 4 protein [Anaerolineales bacterium]|nr:glycosyltransferase family 4 protein [Anaerolineales bacterium]
MRILTALTYYRPHYSGLTIYTERLARALAARGHQVTVLTSRFDDSLLPRQQCDGVEVIRPRVWFHVSKGVIMPAIIPWAWKLARRADVIHLHVPQLDAAPIALIGKLLGRPVVLTYHCDLRLPPGFVHAIANQVSNLANHITATAAEVVVHNTRDYAEHSPFLRRYLNKLRPIYPPVEVIPVSPAERLAFREKFGLQPSDRIIGMAARLATEKGVEYLAQALPLVLEKIPRARVLFVGPYQNVVGEEDYAQRVAALIEPLGDRWSFLGVVSPTEMAAFFHESEALALPSVNSTESFGMVQVEAMACGAPVAASDLPGVRVPVSETSAGRIVPVADARALAAALVDILERPCAYRGQPETLVQLSTPEAVAARYEALFEELLARCSRAVSEKRESRSKITECR